jgi:hypothetical protein
VAKQGKSLTARAGPDGRNSRATLLPRQGALPLDTRACIFGA